jgi:hypothetical protein
MDPITYSQILDFHSFIEMEECDEEFLSAHHYAEEEDEYPNEITL